MDTLKSFGVQTKILDICRGPAVTRYEIQPAAGVKISKITNLSDDLALNLAATGVRIEAPIPGKAAVGIEVPNKKRNTVRMRDLIQSNAFQTSKSKLTVALGRDIAGQPVVADLAQDAPSAHRRHHRIGQVRVHQLPDSEHALQGHPGRGALFDDRPQSGGADGVQRHAPHAGARGHRPPQGLWGPGVGGVGDDEAV